jgi:hypothetical protein
LESVPSGTETPVQRNPSFGNIRSMTPSDVLSTSPPLPSNGAGALVFNKKPVPDSPSSGSSELSGLSPVKKADSSPKLPAIEQSRGNWGNRIVLTTYPGQANVGNHS